MESVERLLADGDIRFLLQTVLPERAADDQTVALVRGDPAFLEALLAHERVFGRLLADETALLGVSPVLFFTSLLAQARRELENQAYTLERRARQRIAMFDARPAARLLGDVALRNYLATMLASFMRVQSVTHRIRLRHGVWLRWRSSDLDVDSLIRYASSVEPEARFGAYRRIGDVCLFLAGMFPEFLDARRSYAGSHSLHGAARTWRNREDVEREGRAFYALAAEHPDARAAHLQRPLQALADNLCLAEKPLTFLADHYLQLRKHTLFAF
ncbi:MAG: hypothetical protein ACUVX9_01860 [Anaerolineae bacterium]